MSLSTFLSCSSYFREKKSCIIIIIIIIFNSHKHNWNAIKGHKKLQNQDMGSYKIE